MSLDVNGSTQYADIALLVPTKPYTVAIWFKPDIATPPVSSSEYMWSAHEDSHTNTENLGSSLRTNSKINIVDEGETTFAAPNTANSHVGQTWQLSLCIFTSSTSRRIVLDGDWANSTLDTANLGTDIAYDDFVIGALEQSSDGFQQLWFDGKLAGFCVWDIAFTEAMSDALWASGVPAPPKNTQTGDVIHYTEFFSSVTSEVGNDAVLQNSPSFITGDHPYTVGENPIILIPTGPLR